MNLAHDILTTRPLAYGDWLCGCEGCAYALRHTVDTTGDVALVFKRADGRNIVSAHDYLTRPFDLIRESLDGPHDYLREVFIGAMS